METTILDTVVIAVLGFICIVGLAKISLDYVFFYGKSKSFRKAFKKRHNIIYKVFCLYVFNKGEMKKTEYSSWIKKLYSVTFIFELYGIFLLATSISAYFVENMTPMLDVFGLIYCVVVIAYFIWYCAHLEDRMSGIRGLYIGTFRIHLPGMKPKKDERRR